MNLMPNPTNCVWWPLHVLTLAGKSHKDMPGVTSLEGAPNQLITC